MERGQELQGIRNSALLQVLQYLWYSALSLTFFHLFFSFFMWSYDNSKIVLSFIRWKKYEINSFSVFFSLFFYSDNETAVYTLMPMVMADQHR